MPERRQRYSCRDVHSVAAVETLDSYEDELDFYRERNFTFVPLPLDGRYYDLRNGELRALAEGQIVAADSSVYVALEALLEHPFVLTKDVPTYGYEVEDGALEMVSPVAGMDVEELAERHPEHVEAALDYEEGKRWGIVTLADVNRHTMRAALYPLYAELEQRFAAQLREHYPDSADLSDATSELGLFEADDRDHWQEAKAADVDVHLSEHMHLYEMKEVVEATESLRSEWGFDTETAFDDHFGGVVHQRDRIMHPARTLVRDRDELASLVDRIQRLRDSLESSEAGLGAGRERLRG